MSQFETLTFDKRGPLAHVSLNRPQVLNAYNVQMRDDFHEALSAVEDDPEVGALVLTGEGRAFCAGADLTEFGTAPSQVIARNVRWQRDVWGLLLGLKQPVVCAVHGFCIGSGLEIALFCDLRLAAKGTVFAMPEVQLGMVPAAGGTQTLPRNTSESRALDLLLTGRRFSAEEALAMGLVTRIVHESGLRSAALELGRRLATGDRVVQASAKAALGKGMDLTLEEGLGLERRLAARLLARAAFDHPASHEPVSGQPVLDQSEPG